MNDETAGQRIDKWLWHARFGRSRTLAAKLVTSGKIRVDRNKVTSASYKVKPGQVLTLALPSGVRVVRIVGISDRRVAYPVAITLYEDLSPPETETASPEKPALPGVAKRPPSRERKEISKRKRDFPM